jgi:sterol desaturase/sphingolipid hydroxylase (fatty acid hydroxylase superfamily)
MDNRYIALAVPVFFALIGIELAVARLARRRGIYRFTDAVTDLSCGITSQVAAIFFGASVLAAYVWVYQHRWVTYQSVWLPAVIAFVGVDFFYYWWHRLSHEVNLLWAAHVVHHQSEDYNLAVALRQAVLTHFTAVPFYLPLALAGVPPVIYATTHAFSTLYQFWIHTELVGKTRGPVDWILNLPSHHRVHHAVNPRYLDKNYGATLIIWDRLFGTYVEETERPVYGITKPLGSFNPLWAQIHYFFDMTSLAARAPRLGDKLRVWFASPAWKPRGVDVPAPPPSIDGRAKYDARPTRARAAYVLLQFGLISIGTFCVMMWSQHLPRAIALAAGGAIVLALWSFGALLENKRWAWPLETARLAATAGVAFLALHH